MDLTSFLFPYLNINRNITKRINIASPFMLKPSLTKSVIASFPKVPTTYATTEKIGVISIDILKNQLYHSNHSRHRQQKTHTIVITKPNNKYFNQSFIFSPKFIKYLQSINKISFSPNQICFLAIG